MSFQGFEIDPNIGIHCTQIEGHDHEGDDESFCHNCSHFHPNWVECPAGSPCGDYRCCVN